MSEPFIKLEWLFASWKLFQQRFNGKNSFAPASEVAPGNVDISDQ